MMAIYRRFFAGLRVQTIDADTSLHLLNDQERAALRRTRRNAMTLAFLTSLLCNLCLFLPLYFFPQFFPIFTVQLPFINLPFAVEIGPWLWIACWVFIEITLLVLQNIRSVHGVAVATGYLTAANKPERSEEILRIAFAAPAKELANYGIDPFQGSNRFSLFLFNFILQMKGVLLHQIIRLLLLRFMGRYALRAVLDFSGVPIYGTLNALGARAIIRESQVIIMGSQIGRIIAERLPQRALNTEEQRLVYDSLQYIAISKRDFHRNHFLLARMLLGHYAIPIEQAHVLTSDFHERLQLAAPDLRALCSLVLALGFIFDGRISWRERPRIDALNRHNILAENYTELQKITRDFVAGKGVEPLLARYLGDPLPYLRG
jgi:hypothetical protein